MPIINNLVLSTFIACHVDSHLSDGGQGLVHLSSRGATFHFHFLQRFLCGPANLVWRPLACTILNRLGGLGLNRSLFLMDLKQANIKEFPVFYCRLCLSPMAVLGNTASCGWTGPDLQLEIWRLCYTINLFVICECLNGNHIPGGPLWSEHFTESPTAPLCS